MLTQKLIFIIVIILVLIGCAIGDPKFTNAVDYKFTNAEVDFGIRGLEEIPSSYWIDKEFVSVLTVMEKKISAEYAGSKNRQALEMASLISNPILFGFVGIMVNSYIRKQLYPSPEFQKNINSAASNSRWIKEEFFFDLLKQRLIFPSPVQPSFKLTTYDAIKKQEVKWKPEIESDAYVTISVVVFMQADPNFEGAEPKAKMVFITNTSVIGKEEMQRQMAFFEKKFPSLGSRHGSEPIYFPEAQPILAGIQREKILHGTYQGSIFKETEFFEHSRWLSDNGNFFEKNIKALAEESIFELSQKIGKGASP